MRPSRWVCRRGCTRKVFWRRGLVGTCAWWTLGAAKVKELQTTTCFMSTSPTSTAPTSASNILPIASRGSGVRFGRAAPRSCGPTVSTPLLGCQTAAWTSFTWTPGTTSQAWSQMSALGGPRCGSAAYLRATTSWMASSRRAISSGSPRFGLPFPAWRGASTSHTSRTATHPSSCSSRPTYPMCRRKQSQRRPSRGKCTRSTAGTSRFGATAPRARLSEQLVASVVAQIARSGSGATRRGARLGQPYGLSHAGMSPPQRAWTPAPQSWSWTCRRTARCASIAAT
mmetsp:Transcript_103288/g.316098  ORF Transcript_103288/g.316098 Transcript_103288/m.316098 type:complete len:284 (-) Transcript_103288:60-911(-)